MTRMNWDADRRRRLVQKRGHEPAWSDGPNEVVARIASQPTSSTKKSNTKHSSRDDFLICSICEEKVKQKNLVRHQWKIHGVSSSKKSKTKSTTRATQKLSSFRQTSKNTTGPRKVSLAEIIDQLKEVVDTDVKQKLKHNGVGQDGLDENTAQALVYEFKKAIRAFRRKK